MKRKTLHSRQAFAALLAALLLGSGFLAGCASFSRNTNSPPVESYTYAEKRLLEIVKRQREFFDSWEAEPDLFRKESMKMRATNIARSYDAYLADNPDDLQARILYGKFLVRLDQPESAIRQFLYVDREDPTIAVVKQQIGNYLAENGRYMAALPYFLNAIFLNPDEPIYPYQLGTLIYEFRPHYLYDGFFSRRALDREMQSAFARAARLDPESFPFQLRYAESFYDVENPDWEAALLQWREAEKRAPTDFDRQFVRLHQARVLHFLGRSGEATRIAKSVTEDQLQFTRKELLAAIGETSG